MQYIYVHPRHNMVIVKSSAYPDYGRDGEQRTLQAIEAFRAMAALGGGQGRDH